MVDKRVIDYIKKGLSMGYGRDYLKKSLISTGWTKEEVDSAMRMVKGAPAAKAKPPRASEHTAARHMKTRPKKPQQKTKKRLELNKAARLLPKKKTALRTGPVPAVPKSEAGPDKPSIQPVPIQPDKPSVQQDKPKGHHFFHMGHGNAKSVEVQKPREKDAGEAKGGKKPRKGRAKEEEIPIIYMKPAGKVTTEVDDMLEIISQKRSIRTDALARMMKAEESEIMEWMETLENFGIVKIHYPLFGKPILMIAAKGGKEGNESSKVL